MVPPPPPAHSHHDSEPPPAMGPGDALAVPDLYLNRELTWLAFNSRVLAEATDKRNPPLERLKFLAITGSNLDEFFMKRIGGLKQQVATGVSERTVDGRTPAAQIAESRVVVRAMIEEQRRAIEKLLRTLKKRGVRIEHYSGLKGKERQALRDRYMRDVFPLVTPHAMSPAHPFPFVSNLSLNLLVSVSYPDEDRTSLARVKVPIGAGIPRFMRVTPEAHRYVPLEEVMAENLDLLFPDMRVDACELFRVTRNANTETDEEDADDLLEMIQAEVRNRKVAPIVRLEVARGMAPERRRMLAQELELDDQSEVYEVDGMLAYRDLAELAQLAIPDLRDTTHRPLEHPRLVDVRAVLDTVRDTGPILVHHPYHSFDATVLRMLREASQDPQVRAIKMALYRTEPEVISHLVEAARNGKQVTVVVELKARFDEEANIRTVERLEDAGINLTYGVVGLKTHSKVTLVVRQERDGLRRYGHVATGNYHPTTARLYSDIGILTCDPDVGHDLTELFNYLTTGYRPNRAYRKLLVAPKGMKRQIISLIERETALHSAKSPGHIQMKLNALEDADVIRALYGAARAGVKIDLIVRDTCRLRPKLAGISDSVTVVSIVGRFLEHARVIYFRNGGTEQYYIGSADAMRRNLQSRVEVLVPVEDAASKAELRAILDIQLGDMRNAWLMRADGSYERRDANGHRGTSALGTHQALIERAERQLRQSSRLRRRKPRGPERSA